MKKIGIYIIVLALFQMACSQTQQPSQLSDDDIALRKEIGQMLLVGFRGTALDDTNHIVRDIRQYNIGGVILFEYDAPSRSRPRNITSPSQLKALCQQLQSLSHSTLLIGIDQEGGNVSRLKQKYGFPYFAGPRQMTNGGKDSVTYYARLTAKTLSEMGINLNFAPCVDVDINPECPIIGKLGRSFGTDPEQVALYAKIWIGEQRKQGIISCLKHFPGHGSSKDDTHSGLADVSNTWDPSEIIPYQRLVTDMHQTCIMTTHVFNANLDSVYPATLSYATLTGMLRDSLHYDGVIVTDDLAMGAMTKQYAYEEILQHAIMAGADLLCLSNNGQEYDKDLVPKTIDLIYEMVKTGKIKRSRIHESCSRINKLKSTISH